MPNHGGRGHVVHATWIDEAIVQSDAAAQARWQARQARQHDGSPPLRLLFAGRLQEDKGIHVMLDALRRLRSAGRTRVLLSIIGAGALESVCREQAQLSDDRVQLDVLDPVAYGEPFFALLRRFDAVLVPSLADEQPRIVYDAYSQALPVLASATPGLRPASPTASTAACSRRPMRKPWPTPSPGPPTTRRRCTAWAWPRLTTARAMTHQNMHRRRHALIARLLAERGLA